MLKKEMREWINTLESLDYPTPFKLTRTGILRDKVNTLKVAIPRVEIYYSVKSANDPEIIKAIEDLVDGYDIASQGEFDQLRKSGVDTSRILYSNPVKIPAHIEKTYKAGVRYFAYDSITEIEKLSEFAPGSDVYLRLKVSDYGSKFPLSRKFGADPNDAVTLIEAAKDFGLNPIGLAFHVGSQSENLHTWEAAFETVGELIKKLEEAGYPIKLLNIGGGFPATYADRIPSVDELAKVINTSIKTHVPEDVRILAEPGRFISANASVIVTSVIGRAQRAGEDWLFLDMGVFQGLMEPLEMSNWRYPIFTKKGNGNLPYSVPFALTGPSCDAYDTIGFEYFLPKDIDVGDRVYIGSAGAYTTVYESTFNGLELLTKYYIK